MRYIAVIQPDGPARVQIHFQNVSFAMDFAHSKNGW
jgi:hypothetical protein